MPLLPITSRTFGLTKRPLPRTTSTLRCLASTLRPPVSLPTTWLFQSRSFPRSIFGAPKAMPRVGHLVRILDHLGGMQQRLGGNAADVQAHAPERRPALDQRDLQSQVRRAERGGVTPGARAEHQQLRGAAEALLRTGAAPGIRRGHAHRVAGGLGRRRGGGGSGRRGGGGRTLCLDPRDERALGNLVAALEQHLGHRAGAGGRHVHRGLVGLERDQRRLQLDHVAGLHQHVDHGHVREVADVRHDEVHAHGTASISARGSASACARKVVKRAAIAPSMTR